MSAAAPGQERAVAPAPDRRELLSIAHYHNPSTSRTSERTCLLEDAIAVISLGITMNRFSGHLYDSEHIEHWRPLDLLKRTSQVRLEMVPFGCVWIVLALHRYRRVERAIDNGDLLQRRLIEWLTFIALLGAALGIIWMFPG